MWKGKGIRIFCWYTNMCNVLDVHSRSNGMESINLDFHRQAVIPVPYSKKLARYLFSAQSEFFLRCDETQHSSRVSYWDHISRRIRKYRRFRCKI